METLPASKTYPNVYASGNAVLHLGDVVYVSRAGEQGERVALKQIIERLDHIINTNGPVRQVGIRQAENHGLSTMGSELTFSSENAVTTATHLSDSQGTSTIAVSGTVSLSYVHRPGMSVPRPGQQ